VSPAGHYQTANGGKEVNHDDDDLQEVPPPFARLPSLQWRTGVRTVWEIDLPDM